MSSTAARFVRLTLIATAGCAVLAGALLAHEFEASCDLSGSISFQNTQVAVGTPIQAYAGSVLLADTTVRVSGYYAISIPPDNPATAAVDGWVDGAEITIHVDGRSALPTIAPAGMPLYQNLSVPTVSDVRKSTWGKIKALFR